MFVLFCFFSVTMELSAVALSGVPWKDYFHQPKSPIGFLFIHYFGETTFIVRKVSGKGVAKTIVGWLTRMCRLLCKLLVFLVSNFWVIPNTKQIV